MSATLTFPGRPLERYRDFDMYPGQFGRDWQALHKDADDADDDRVMWAKNHAGLIAEVDQWHWEQSVEPLVEALEVVAGGDVDVSDTAIIVGNGASTVMAQVHAALALAKAETPQTPNLSPTKGQGL